MIKTPSLRTLLLSAVVIGYLAGDHVAVAHAADLIQDDVRSPSTDFAIEELRAELVSLPVTGTVAICLDANSLAYRALADWFRSKLGTIVLGDGRVECDWSKPNSYNISHFAGGATPTAIRHPRVRRSSAGYRTG